MFREIFDDEDLVLEPEMTAEDVKGWDSARMVEIITAAESRFGVRFSTREIDRLRCVGDFIDLIERKASGPSARG